MSASNYASVGHLFELSEDKTLDGYKHVFLGVPNQAKCDTFSYVHRHARCGKVMSGRHVVLVSE